MFIMKCMLSNTFSKYFFRGIELRPANVTKTLYCKYETMGMPYYTYGPRKVEVVSLRPYIAVIHEFITDSETDMLIQVREI